MEHQTRTNKYAKLRESIASDQEDINYHDALAPFAKKLSAIDEKYDVDADKIKSDYIPNHAKTKAYQELFLDESEDLISNDFLEKFIEEVKHYNVEAGTRYSSETAENILASYSLKGSDESSTRNEIVKDDLKQSIEHTQKMSAMIHDDENDDEQDDELIDDVLSLLHKEKPSFNLKSDEDDDDYKQRDEVDFYKSKTQELTQIVETMEHSLSDVNQKVIATNRLVNFLLAIFIVGLLIVGAYVIYLILGLQGIL